MARTASIRIDESALPDFLARRNHRLDNITLEERVKNARRVLLEECLRPRGEVAFHVLDPGDGTANGCTLYSCLYDRLQLEFTRTETCFRSWRQLWLVRHYHISLLVVAL